MAGFCVNCGAPLTGAFCNKCGAKAQGPSSPSQLQATAPSVTQLPVAVSAAAPSAVQPAVTVAKGSGLGKVLAIVGGVLLLLFVIGVGAAIYGVYWVKHKVSTYTAAVTGGGSSPQVKVERGNSCRLLQREDLAQVLGGGGRSDF